MPLYVAGSQCASWDAKYHHRLGQPPIKTTLSAPWQAQQARRVCSPENPAFFAGNSNKTEQQQPAPASSSLGMLHAA